MKSTIFIIMIFHFLLSSNVYAIHTFSCGTYLVRGTLEEHPDRGHILIISEGSYSETSMYPAISAQLKNELPKLPHRGYFTISVNSKETIKENVNLIAWDIDDKIPGESAKNDVNELKKSACTQTVKTPIVIEAKYPAAPKEGYRKTKK